MKMYVGGPRLNRAFIYYISLESTISLVETRVEDPGPATVWTFGSEIAWVSQIQICLFFRLESGSGQFPTESTS